MPTCSFSSCVTALFHRVRLDFMGAIALLLELSGDHHQNCHDTEAPLAYKNHGRNLKEAEMSLAYRRLTDYATNFIVDLP